MNCKFIKTVSHSPLAVVVGVLVLPPCLLHAAQPQQQQHAGAVGAGTSTSYPRQGLLFPECGFVITFQPHQREGERLSISLNKSAKYGKTHW